MPACRIACLAFTLLIACRDASGMTIADAKLLPNGQPASLTARVVTYAVPGFFYIEEDMRSSGIRVERSGHGLDVGMRADVSGTILTNAHGERFISAGSASQSGTGAVVPVFMNGMALGGGDWHYAAATGAGQVGVSGGSGLNSVGLLVRVQGTVKQGAPGDTEPFVIDDGSGAHVQVVLPAGVTSPGFGARVAVTGVVSCALEHQQVTGPASPTYRDFHRRVVLATSVQIIQPAPTWRYTGDMVYVPAGPFLMGNSGMGDDAVHPEADELPQHTVYLSGYWIGKRQVTRAEYSQFISEGGYTDPSYWSAEGWAWRTLTNRTQPDYWAPEQDWGTGTFTQTPSHPVAGITYYEAEAFCKWAGGHLPTEAQYEKAARWDGHPRVYPWGDFWDPARCNSIHDTLYPGQQTAPVGSYPLGASPYGCLDMAGNVWQWCGDWYAAGYYSQVPVGGWLDPTGPARGTRRAMRLCSYEGHQEDMRGAYRSPYAPYYGWPGNGIRIAR